MPTETLCVALALCVVCTALVLWLIARSVDE